MAAWKKKEKVLSEEEAIAQARSQLAPFWSGSVPRLAAIRQAGGAVSVYPLDKEFVQSSWMIFFFDPLCYDGRSFVRLAREWNRRYSSKTVGSLAVIRVTYPFQIAPGYLEGLRKALSIPFSLVLDVDGLIATNTTTTRPDGFPLAETGGLSGAPLRDQADATLELIANRAQGRLTLIGVGGIMSADDLQRKLDRGAILCQAYTGFVYGGPIWPSKVLMDWLIAHPEGRSRA